ncbi:hypothetical protein GO755_00160 [Spirosoma sp. HMF4905]|uniref:Uncharacterized protein n=1 Tax=Spirosoma arboris TaxID=2682092 RepID=A0A7K1S3N2_9BACT|nr:S24/S26 family peptidase [Spirosoma arboris]MVM28424.1 hypothetical protein [Spirosoma arboris]
MTTGQNYVGRGNYATPPPQQAQNAALPCPLADSQTPVTANPRIMEAQKRLLDLEDLFAQRGNYAPIQLLEDLILHWLITSSEDLTAQQDPEQLQVILLLIQALEQVYPIDSLPTMNRQGHRVEPSRLYKKFTTRLSPDFLNQFMLSEEDELRAGLVHIQTDSMAPQIEKGNSVLVVSADPATYEKTSGIVLVVMSYMPHYTFIGRIIQNDGQSLLLLPDNSVCSEVRLVFTEMSFLSEVRYIINKKPL